MIIFYIQQLNCVTYLYLVGSTISSDYKNYYQLCLTINEMR